MANPDANSSGQEAEISRMLEPHGKEELIRFFNVFADELDRRPYALDANLTEGRIRSIIAGNLTEEAMQFAENYQRLRDESIRINPAVQHLSEEYEIPAEELDIGSLSELLVLLYEYELEDKLTAIIAGTDIRKYRWNRRFEIDQSIDLEQISNKLNQFHEKWNSREETGPIRIVSEAETENSSILRLFSEKQSGSTRYSTFEFRKDSENLKKVQIPTEPEVGEVDVYELKSLRLALDPKVNKTTITLNGSRYGWKRLLNPFFEFVFGVEDFYEKMEPHRPDKAEDIESDLDKGVEEDIASGEGNPLDSARKVVENRRSAAKSEIDSMNLPPSQKQNLKDCVDTITVSGSDIQDDQSIGADEFRLIGELPQLFRSVDIESGFRDMLSKADSEKRSFVIQVNSKDFKLKNGRWKKLDPGSIGDTERQALEIFFKEGSS